MRTGCCGCPSPGVSASPFPAVPAAAATALAQHPWLRGAAALVQVSPLAYLGNGQGIGWNGVGAPGNGASAANATLATGGILVDTHVHIGAPLVAWLLLWTVGFLWLSWVVFRSSQAERWQEPSTRPTWVVAILWGFASVLAYLLAQTTMMVVGAPFGLVFFVTLVVFGGGSHLLYRRTHPHVSTR